MFEPDFFAVNITKFYYTKEIVRFKIVKKRKGKCDIERGNDKGMKGCMIAGTSSGCGKTTISTGIMAALRQKGLEVAPFKAGPDYIDTGFHEKATGRQSVNLDVWLCGEENVRYLYGSYSADCDIGIVEGAMGLYDGMGCENIFCSSADIANIIGLPVILAIDGSGISMSAAALVKGFAEFDRKTDVAGVIFNRVSGEEHYQILKQVIETKTKIKCIGYLPAIKDFLMPERHLGLIPAGETKDLEQKIALLAESVKEHVDLDLLLKLCKQTKRTGMPRNIQNFIDKNSEWTAGKTIGVAMDDAFHFYYGSNIDLLKMTGANIVYFSPLRDAIPPAADALYIGGGFPEEFASELEENTVFREALREKLESGTPCYAECGGLMYLCNNIEDMQGTLHAMAGFFPATVRMTQGLQRFGYATVTTRAGQEIHAHEFHYSCLGEDQATDYYFRVQKPDGSQSWQCGLSRQKTVAGYPHLHFWGNPQVIMELFFG